MVPPLVPSSCACRGGIERRPTGCGALVMRAEAMPVQPVGVAGRTQAATAAPILQTAAGASHGDNLRNSGCPLGRPQPLRREGGIERDENWPAGPIDAWATRGRTPWQCYAVFEYFCLGIAGVRVAPCELVRRRQPGVRDAGTAASDRHIRCGLFPVRGRWQALSTRPSRWSSRAQGATARRWRDSAGC